MDNGLDKACGRAASPLILDGRQLAALSPPDPFPARIGPGSYLIFSRSRLMSSRSRLIFSTSYRHLLKMTPDHLRIAAHVVKITPYLVKITSSLKEIGRDLAKIRFHPEVFRRCGDLRRNHAEISASQV